VRTLHLAATALIGASLLVTAAPQDADAQIWRRAAERAQERAQERVERSADRAVDRAVDAAFDLAENEVACVVDDRECVAQAERAGADVVLVDEDGERAEPAAATPAAATPAADRAVPGEGAWANYDFVPGDRVLFAEDFEGETIGRFPRRLEFLNGMMEVVEWEGRTLLRSTDNRSEFRIELAEALPQRFTVEFDVFFASRRLNDQVAVATYPLDRVNLRNARESLFYLSPRDAGVQGPRSSTTSVRLPDDEMVTVRISVDGTYSAMYVNEQRVANAPNIELARDRYLYFRLGSHSEPSYLGDVRIAAGGQEMMYDRLMGEGRVVTRGILFDTGSDRIRPESTPTLNEIGEMLRSHSDLSLRIEGHTDSVGSASANQALSERRAAAVRQHLIERFGVDGGRLESVGIGEANPVDGNDTPEGRQNNRRVELVRR
jgi:OmpA-OmpF porin, OOP family